MDRRTFKSLKYKNYLISFCDKVGGYDEFTTENKKQVFEYIKNNNNDLDDNYIKVYGVNENNLVLIYDSRK